MTADDGSWMKPPPEYPPIKTLNALHNLEIFIDMKNVSYPGKVLNCIDFLNKFSCK